jgi:hypothetical protein
MSSMMLSLPAGARGSIVASMVTRRGARAYRPLVCVGALIMTLSCSSTDVVGTTADAASDAPAAPISDSEASRDRSLGSEEPAAPIGPTDAKLDHAATRPDTASPGSDGSSADASYAPDAMTSGDARHAADVVAPISTADARVDAEDASFDPTGDASPDELPGDAADARSAADVLTGPACEAADQVIVEGTIGATTELSGIPYSYHYPGCYDKRGDLHVDRVICGTIAGDVVLAGDGHYDIVILPGRAVFTLQPWPGCFDGGIPVHDNYTVTAKMRLADPATGDAAASE